MRMYLFCENRMLYVVVVVVFVVMCIILCTDYSLFFTSYVRVTKKEEEEENIEMSFWGYGGRRKILNTYQIGKKIYRYIYLTWTLIHWWDYLAPSLTTGTMIGAGIGKFCGSKCLK
jgi:hypothetical protein